MEEKIDVKRLLRKYVKKYIYLALLSVTAVVLFSICEIMQAEFLKTVVDAAKDKELDTIVRFIIFGVAAMAVGCVLTYFGRLLAGKFAALVICDIKRDSSKHIADIPVSCMDTERTGEILSKLSSDSDVVQSFMETSFINFIRIPFSIVFFSAYLIALNPALFLICFIPIPILAFAGASFATPFKKGSWKYMDYLGKVNNTVNDTVNGISIVKAYNLENTLLRKYGGGIKKATDMAMRNDKYQYSGSTLFSMLRCVTALTCIAAGGWMCRNGSLTAGSLISFMTLLSKLVEPFISASSILFLAKQAMASAERLLSVLMTETERSGEYCGEEGGTENIIEFKNVHFEYEHGAPVLNGLSFKVERGKTTAFAGESGCGKSTVFSLLCSFYQCESGHIIVKGHEIEEWDMKKLRENISYVAQSSYLFPVSIYENIAMGRKNASKEEIIEAAKRANAHEFITELPEGYDTIVGERGCRFSGGQVQRIAIARAVLKNAPILLLDEATSALDTQSEYLVQQALNNLSVDKTVLVIAHRLSTIRNADKIIVIDRGRLAEEGTHEELIMANGIYEMLCRANESGVSMDEE